LPLETGPGHGDDGAVFAQILLFDGFDPLDVIAPFEVLAAGDVDVHLVAAGGPQTVVSGTRGLTLTATAALDPARPGYLIVPGASGPVDGDPDDGVETIPVLLARLAASDAMTAVKAALDDPAVTVACVCGGSLALAMAGLLEGRTAVTHVLGLEVLEATGVRMVPARVVDDGDLITAGGVTSGLDLALHILEREFGSPAAHAVERLFEYERRGTVWKTVHSG
jgi:transcriptional regulator GlxA family with amidase domain